MLILHIHLYLDKREHVYCNIRAFLWKIDKKNGAQREQKQEQDLKVNKSQPNEKLRKMIE